MESVIGSKTSVYVGTSSRDYEAILLRDSESPAKYLGTGVGTSLLANRVSWFYDLRGPSIALDTACSSSLVALHLACQSLRNHESNMVSRRPEFFPKYVFKACCLSKSGTGRRLQHDPGTGCVYGASIEHGLLLS